MTKRNLIEVWLPLEQIIKREAREKSIRHGHPSTLHLWWARRPLAAARAVLFSQLPVDDDTWLVSPSIALAQRRREQSVETSQEPGEGVGSTTTAPSGPGAGGGAAQVPGSGGAETRTVVRNARYRARVEVDGSKPDRITSELREALDEVVLHILRAKGAEGVEITLEVSAETAEGFDDATVRIVKENSRVLDCDLSEFEDVEL